MMLNLMRKRMPLLVSQTQKTLLSARLFSSAQAAGPGQPSDPKPNLVQMMPEYQEALKLATEEKYPESIAKLHDAIKAIEVQVGPNSKFHLYLYRRLASMHMMLGQLDEVEQNFLNCIKVAENAPKQLQKNVNQDISTFIWQDNLLRWYMEQDIPKAIELATEMLEEQGTLLEGTQQRADLKFNLATSMTLQGKHPEDGEYLNKAIALYKESLAENIIPQKNGAILNNLGMTHFHQFVAKSAEIGDPQQKGMDAVLPVIEHFEEAIHQLRMSVNALEDFPERFKSLDPDNLAAGTQTGQTEIEVELAKQKLFVDEIFSTQKLGSGAVLPPKLKHYDVRQNHSNTEFLKTLFTNPPSVLPVQNLGEISLIMGDVPSAFTLLDMSLKLYAQLDTQNPLKMKVLTFLGQLLDMQQNHDGARQIHNVIFENLKNVDCYEGVFCMRNYGYMLAKRPETAQEGKDYIEKAEETAAYYPYWSERRMSLFVPQIAHIEDIPINL